MPNPWVLCLSFEFFPLSFEFFSLSFEYIYWVLVGNLWNIWVFSLKTLFIGKKWVIFLSWEFDFAINCAIFQNVSFKFWSKNAGKQRFLLECWVISLSFRFLEFRCPWVFFGGAQKKPGVRTKNFIFEMFATQRVSYELHTRSKRHCQFLLSWNKIH